MGLKQRKCIPYSPGGLKSEAEVLAGPGLLRSHRGGSVPSSPLASGGGQQSLAFLVCLLSVRPSLSAVSLWVFLEEEQSYWTKGGPTQV